MTVISRSIRGLAAGALLLALPFAWPARADDLRSVKVGEPMPAYHLPTLDGKTVSSDELLGKTVVVVCLSAEQHRSELAAVESFDVVKALGNDNVRLIHVTADADRKDYFEEFREEHGIDVPLAFDADRGWSAKLGLIVLPTTVVIGPDDKLVHVISLHSSRYGGTLDAYIRHALGELSDAELEHRLEAAASHSASTRTLALGHRAQARAMRDKGLTDSAKAELLKARELQPDDPEIVLDLADLDLAMGELDQAAELVDLVLKAQPEHRRALQMKAIVCFRRGQFDQAEALFNEALKLNPKPEQIHYYLGQICEARGDTKDALAHYREALRRLLEEPG